MSTSTALVDLSSYAGQHAHYSAVQNRLRGPVQRSKVLRAPPLPVKVTTALEAMETTQDDASIMEFPIHAQQWERIMHEVRKKHGVSMLDMLSIRRGKPILKARYEAMYRMRMETSLSLPQIGVRMGGRDHSTVMYGIAKHVSLMDKKTKIKRRKEDGETNPSHEYASWERQHYGAREALKNIG